MASREYCSSVSEELEYWSDRLHEVSDKFDSVSSIDKYKLQPEIEDLHIVMTEMDDRLCEMMTSCSTAERLQGKDLRLSV